MKTVVSKAQLCIQSEEETNMSEGVRKERKRNDSYNFRDLANEEAREGNEKDVQDVLGACPEANKKEKLSKDLASFQKLFRRFLAEDTQEVPWNKIDDVSDDMIKSYKDLSEPTTNIKEMLDKLVVVKLNGLSWTGMGCDSPCSGITVRNDFTFLDMTVQQLENLNEKYACAIPLVLMNSFITHDETEDVLRKYVHVNVPIHSFQQSQYPRIFKESLRTVTGCSSHFNNTEHWYPPGHGDFYQSFYNSGLLEQFIKEGKEYVFVSNIDNLGATVDLSILSHFLNQKDDESRSEFLMEVTDKTKADVQGGTLIKYGDKLRLLEIAQVSNKHIEDFKSVSRFKVFNTNNVWVQLEAIKRILDSDSLHVDIITKHTQLDNGDKVIQFATAMGAAIKCFNRSSGINVPRSRFLPVKTCSDIFLVKSNLYKMNKGTLSMNPARQFASTPIVLLGNSFKKLNEFLGRLDGMPDIIDLDHLTVAGDVTFGAGVVLRGTVIIIANHGECINIPPGAILENKIVSGNLRIMKH